MISFASIPALWIAAIALKVLVWLAAPGHVLLDRLVNFGLIALAAVSIYRVVALARSDLLWRVSRRLILSYILVGAVPILLLVTFSLLAFLLVFFDVSAYLVHERVARLMEQASIFSRTTLFEVDRTPPAARAEIAERRQAAISSRYPGVRVILASSETLPDWLPRQGFVGLVDQGRIARAVMISAGAGTRHAVIVDLPVESSLDEAALAAAGIRIGDDRPPSPFNTATFLEYVDWQTGALARTPVAISVDVGRLYDWLGGSRDGGTLNLNRLLLYVLASIGVLLLVIEMIALGNGLALARTITTSVDELFDGTERVKRGDFSHRIPVRADDQLGRLTASFNDMTGRISHLLDEQDEKRRLEQELRIAREIQMSLLPQGPLGAPGWSAAAFCAPAREVGGDYYDVLPLGDGRVGLLIADVAGKGTSAALYMAELKGLMLALSRVHRSPRALLIEADRIIARHLDSRSFITMTYAVLDVPRRTLTCARAGHTPILRVAAGSDGLRRADILVPDGMVLGLNLDGGERFARHLEELTLPVAAGDLFLFFTDGVSEAMDETGAWFGEARLAALAERHAAEPPEAIRDALARAVADFAGGTAPHDDITIVILKIDG